MDNRYCMSNIRFIVSLVGIGGWSRWYVGAESWSFARSTSRLWSAWEGRVEGPIFEEISCLDCLRIVFDSVLRMWKKYVNIPSEKYIYVHIYVCICVYTYLCQMDERWSYASLSKKWMSTGLMLACHKYGWVPVLCWLVIKMDEYRSYAGFS